MPPDLVLWVAAGDAGGRIRRQVPGKSRETRPEAAQETCCGPPQSHGCAGYAVDATDAVIGRIERVAGSRDQIVATAPSFCCRRSPLMTGGAVPIDGGYTPCDPSPESPQDRAGDERDRDCPANVDATRPGPRDRCVHRTTPRSKLVVRSRCTCGRQSSGWRHPERPASCVSSTRGQRDDHRAADDCSDGGGDARRDRSDARRPCHRAQAPLTRTSRRTDDDPRGRPGRGARHGLLRAP